MTRLGWTILALIVLSGLAFASMLSFGSGGARAPRPPAPEAPTTAESYAAGALVVPVEGMRRELLVDTWGDPRGAGTRHHEAIDIMAPGGTPVVAAAPGTVEKLFDSDAGGITAYVRSADRRWTYYYAHLAGYAPGLTEGQRVRAGDAIGFVGDTGNAGAGNTHLHFGISRMRADEGWSGGEPVNPYPLLAGRPAVR